MRREPPTIMGSTVGSANASPDTGFATNFASFPCLMIATRPGRRSRTVGDISVVVVVVEMIVVVVLHDRAGCVHVPLASQTSSVQGSASGVQAWPAGA